MTTQGSFLFKNKILFLDFFNVFYSSFAAYQANDKLSGEPTGGFVGTIVQIQKLTDKFHPQKIVVIVDGPNSAERRRMIFKDYKGKRNKKKRYSIMDFGDGDKVEVDNEQEQLRLLYNFLKNLPVDVICIPSYEADDVIAYLVNKNPEFISIISTSDKDYYQLINKNTFVWSPQKKVLYNEELILSTQEIIPHNFTFMRCIVGDPSDKLSGIKGVGKQTLLEKIPQLKTQPFDSFEEFWQEVDKLEDESKTGKKLKENKEQAHLMYKLMKLDYTCLNQKGIEQLEVQLEEQHNKTFSKISLKMYCIKNHLEHYIKNFDEWVRPFNFIKSTVKLSV